MSRKKMMSGALVAAIMTMTTLALADGNMEIDFRSKYSYNEITLYTADGRTTTFTIYGDESARCTGTNTSGTPDTLTITNCTFPGSLWVIDGLQTTVFLSASSGTGTYDSSTQFLEFKLDFSFRVRRIEGPPTFDCSSSGTVTPTLDSDLSGGFDATTWLVGGDVELWPFAVTPECPGALAATLNRTFYLIREITLTLSNFLRDQ
ncbi:MAG: hypothetical protein HYR55_11125 [Acidobacteria bacterium]|nr:hypothetical protein [Acidobacteriota bacterium]MBI3657730.1 hypothetical protein [Acidobacteriota bacterium]